MALSKKQLILVHKAARVCGLDDEAYRDLLRANFGVETSKVLDQKGFEKLMSIYEGLGFTPMRRDGTPMDDPTPPGMMTNQQRWLLMRLIAEMGESPGSPYFLATMKQASGCERVAWLTRETADKTINACREVLRRGRQAKAE